MANAVAMTPGMRNTAAESISATRPRPTVALTITAYAWLSWLKSAA